MTDFIVILVVLIIVGFAAVYVVKAKKNGAKCIGCPAASKCSGKSGTTSGCSCGCNKDTKA